MRRQKMLLIFFLTPFALALAACAPSGENPGQPGHTLTSPPASGEDLAGTRWALISMGKPGEETPVIEGSNATLEFGEDGQVGGSGGCNSYGGKYQVEGETVAIREIESTLMACADEQITAQEGRFLQALGTASRFHIAENRLNIFYDNDQNILNFEPLGASSTNPTQATVISDSNLMPSGPDEKQYTLTAEASQTILVEITSNGAPLSLTITTPSGTERFPEVTQDGSGFRISHSFVTTETGEYRMTLKKADRTPSTNYTVTIAAQ